MRYDGSEYRPWCHRGYVWILNHSLKSYANLNKFNLSVLQIIFLLNRHNFNTNLVLTKWLWDLKDNVVKDFCSGQDKETWIDFAILSETTKGKTDKIYDTRVLRRWTFGNKGLWSPRGGNKWSEGYNDTSLLPWGVSSLWHRQGNLGGAYWTS